MRQGICLFVAIVVIASGSSHAQRGRIGPTVLFNPFGFARGRGLASATKAVDTLDVAVGNALLVGINANTGAGSAASVLFQGNLGNATLAGTPVFGFGFGSTGKPAFTVVWQFDVKVIANSGGILTFAPPSNVGTQGLFRMYRHSSNGDNLAGTCFASDCGGNSVLQGKVINFANFSSILAVNVSTPAQALNQFGASGQPPVNSLQGAGALTFDLVVTGVNPSFFPKVALGSSPIRAIVQLRLPFNQVAPSACFSTDAVIGCNQVGVGSVGTVNGLGGNTIVQADASLSFR
jgi:hypothetical protein